MNRQDVHQPATDTHLLLDGAKSVSQTFVSARDNLNIVSVCVRNPARLLSPLRFDLFVASKTDPIRTINFSGGNVSEDDCTKLQFAPVEDSGGKSYTFTLSSPSFAAPVPANSMYLEVASDDNYSYGTAAIDGTPLHQDAHFMTYYRQDLGAVVEESLAQFVARLPLDLSFLIPYTILLFTVIYKLLRR